MFRRKLFQRKQTLWLLVIAASTFTAACRQDMHNQPRYKPLAATTFFGDGRSARPTIEDTVACGQLRTDLPRFTGKENGKDIDYFPIQITEGDVERGHERFNIYCSPCHGRLGDGNGMIVSRGLRQPPSYHSERLLTAPVGHFFDVMTNGYGAMYSYASRVPVDDRWRIAAYIRALQFSQNPSGNAAQPSAATGKALTPSPQPMPNPQQPPPNIHNGKPTSNDGGVNSGPLGGQK